MTPGEKPFVESLAADDSFETRATLLDFDPLHQRAIFGSLPEETTPEMDPPAARNGTTMKRTERRRRARGIRGASELASSTSASCLVPEKDVGEEPTYSAAG